MALTGEAKRVANKNYQERLKKAKEFLDLMEGLDKEREGKRYKSEALSYLNLGKIYLGQPYKDLDDDDEDPRKKKKIAIPNPSSSEILGLTCTFDEWLELRDRARKDLFWLGKEVFKKDFVPHVHQIVCDQFVQKNFDGAFPAGYTLGDVHNAIKRQERFDAEGNPTREAIILDPRGFYKSTIDSVDCVQWMIAVPDIRILLMAADHKIGSSLMKEIKGYLHLPKGADFTDFHLLFPEYVVRGKDGTSSTPLTLPCRGHFQRFPSLWFNSIESGLSGWHCDIKKSDDVVNDENCTDAEVREALNTKIDGADNLLDEWGFSDNIGTRYYGDPVPDWYGLRIKKASDPENSIKYFCRSCWTVKPEFTEVPLKELTADMVILTFPEKATFKSLRGKLLQNEINFRCFPAGSKVLMSDWTEKSIEQIVPGDEVIGFNGGLEKTTVTYVHSRRDMVVKATTETGRMVFSTKDHEFLMPINRQRREFGHLKVGRKIVSVYKPIPEPSLDEQRLLDWLGGVLDGEGSCASQVAIYQSEVENTLMCSVIRDRLTSLKISFEEHLDTRRGVAQFKLTGGRSLKIRLVQQCLMARKDRFIDSLWKSSKFIAESSGRRGGSAYEKVVLIEDAGEQQVYDLTTKTSNYVCQGFAVHNCQQLNEPAGADKDNAFRITFDEDTLRRHLYQKEAAPQQGDIFICWDWALTSNKRSDFSAGVVGRIYKRSDGRTGLVILEVVCDKWTSSELALQIISLNKKWNPKKTLIENSPGAEWLKNELHRLAPRFGVTLDIFWKPPSLQENAKRNRIKGLEILLKDDLLWFVSGSWIDDTFFQLMRYTGEKKNKGRKDDIPDAMSYFHTAFFPITSMNQKDAEEAKVYLEEEKKKAQLKAQYDRIFGKPVTGSIFNPPSGAPPSDTPLWRPVWPTRQNNT